MPFDSFKFRAARHSPRPRTGSNRHSRICSPIHFHYVTQPNPPPHVPKSNGCSSFTAPSFSTYAVAGGALYMTGGGLPEKRGQLLSPLLNLPFLIESSKPLHYWYRGRIEGCFLYMFRQRTSRSQLLSCKQPCLYNIEFCLPKSSGLTKSK